MRRELLDRHERAFRAVLTDWHRAGSELSKVNRLAGRTIYTIDVVTNADQLTVAGEGGVSHAMPGSNATLVDLPPTSTGWFFKPMYINYQGDASATIPTAAPSGVRTGWS